MIYKGNHIVISLIYEYKDMTQPISAENASEKNDCYSMI